MKNFRLIIFGIAYIALITTGYMSGYFRDYHSQVAIPVYLEVLFWILVFLFPLSVLIILYTDSDSSIARYVTIIDCIAIIVFAVGATKLVRDTHAKYPNDHIGLNYNCEVSLTSDDRSYHI